MAERQKQWVDILMATKRAEQWVNASTTARKTVNYHVTKAANKLVQRNAQNYQFVYDSIEEAVFKIIDALESVGSIDTIAPYELAEIQKDLIRKMFPDRSDWDSIKNYEIQQVRLKHLETIIDKKAKKKEDLLPIEMFALEDKLSSVDVTADDRYNAYNGFLDYRTNDLVDKLRAEVYENELDDTMKRQEQIRELHRLWRDKLTINTGSEAEVWKIVNKEWGIDRGLE